jgi:hypothetical protein
MNSPRPRLRLTLIVLTILGLGVVAALAVPGRFGLVPAANTSTANDPTGQDIPDANQTATPTNTPTNSPTATAGDEDESPAPDEDTSGGDDEKSGGDEDGGDAGPILGSADDPKGKVGPAKGRNTNTVDSPPVDENVDYSLFSSDQRTIRFRNRSNKTVSVAILMYDPNKCGGEGKDWRSAGWWTIAPGETQSVMKTSNGYFAYYAASDDGRYVWPDQSQSGNTRVYVNELAFDSCLGYASTNDFAVNMKSKMAPRGEGTFTVNLTVSA